MEQININVGSTEVITEGMVNDKRKRGSMIEESKIMKQLDNSSKSYLSDSNHGEGTEGGVTEAVNDFEMSVRKESFFSVSVHDKDEKVEISERKESSLEGLLHTENHLSICKEEETVTLPGMVEGSSNQVSAEIVGEQPEHCWMPVEMERKFFPCEGEHLSFPCQLAGENVTIENGLDQVSDGVVINEGQFSAEDGSICSVCNVEGTYHISPARVKRAKYLSNDLEHNPGIKTNPSVTRKLVVLDVNGLLANIVMPAPKDYRGDTRILRRAIFKRPFCDDFLKFCFQNFVVGVWSSRSKKIIDRVVDYLLGDQKDKLLFCWDLSHCTQTRFKTLENIHKPLVFKELRKIWENENPSLPWRSGQYNESNTLLLDDSPYKALLNPLYTAIFPNSFHYQDPNDDSLGPGGDLRVYLEGLLSSENVQTHVEQHPFGQSAINETNSSWSFYSGVLQTMSEQLQDDTIPSSPPMLS